MSSTDQNNPGGKSGQRNRKRKKQEGQKPEQAEGAKALIDAAIASNDATSNDVSEITAVALEDPPPIGEALSAEPVAATAAPIDPSPAAVEVEAAPTAAAAPVGPSPIGLQTIATAYRDYTRKSLAEAHTYVEKLSGARSVDKALEVQTEFAKQAYETFVADSRKIRALYGELFMQALPMGRRER